MTQHKFIEHTKCPHDHCLICDGGLALCEVCLAAEGTLPTDCPGAPIDEETQWQIYFGEKDYREGKWVILEKEKA